MVSRSMSYKKKKALIIGGSEGIGLALAGLLVKEGAQVMIASRSEDKLSMALESLKAEAKKGQKIDSCSLDVTDFFTLKERLESVVKDFGVPDLLVNSAGIAHPGFIEDLEVSKIDQMLDINCRGMMYVCKVLAPIMSNSGGQVLNVSSVAGYIGLFGYTGYCASKAAVLAFSEALREEFIHTELKVSVLCPPNTKTPGLERENLKKPKEVLATEEKVKVLEPEEVAEYTLNKLRKNKFWIIPTMDSQLAFYLKRFLPSVLRMFVRRPQ